MVLVTKEMEIQVKDATLQVLANAKKRTPLFFCTCWPFCSKCSVSGAKCIYICWKLSLNFPRRTPPSLCSMHLQVDYQSLSLKNLTYILFYFYPNHFGVHIRPEANKGRSCFPRSWKMTIFHSVQWHYCHFSHWIL